MLTISLGRILERKDEEGNTSYRLFYPSQNMLIHEKPIYCTVKNFKSKILEQLDLDVEKFAQGASGEESGLNFIQFASIEITVTRASL